MTSPDPEPGLTATFEELGRTDCLELLATATVGRVGLLVDDRPEVLPVNFALDGDTIVFRTAEGTVLNQASLTLVAFEVDWLDPADHSGWSVLLQGTARDIGDAIDPTSERLRQISLITWAPGKRHNWFEIRPDRITGRRIRVVPDAL
jgi:nitroimidazol reductase NimA-like FMN-containing flavoprotein (pyridoxamine 5'-phosphate oxidase superfamily)